jgi:hypothetical protein
MALEKAITLPSGVTAKYWRTVQMNMNCDRPDCVVTLLGYKDEPTRRDGATPLESIQVDLGMDFFASSVAQGTAGDKMRTVVYELVKARANAKDGDDEPIRQLAEAKDV